MTRARDPDFLLTLGRDGKYCAWTPILESAAATVPDAKAEELLHALIDRHFAERHDERGALTDELEALLIDIYASADGCALAIPVGGSVWQAMNWQEGVPIDELCGWGIIHKVTRQAIGNEPLLQDLACCWFEELMDRSEYLPALLGLGVDLEFAVALGTHTGYMPREKQREFRRQLESSLPAEDAAEFRKSVVALGAERWWPNKHRQRGRGRTPRDTRDA